MSGFTEGSGPNLAQYLNSLESEQDSQPTTGHDDIDLSIFTNTQWFDFDSGRTTDFQPQPIKTTNIDSSSTASPAELTAPTPTTATSVPDMSSSMLLQDLTNLDFSQFPMTPQLAGFPDSLGAIPSTDTSPVFSPDNPQLMQSTNGPRTGEKRKASEAVGNSPQVSAEEASRIAAEEDKRRRNTAASARFRHKKKQREQEMERKAKESEEKIAKLEGRVQTLLAENKWLKNMILEKTGGSEDVGKKLEELSAHVREIGQDKIEALAAKNSKEQVPVKEEKS